MQWLRRGYVVRSYDVAARALSTLRARGDPRLMGGIPWGAVASADGRWLLTLLLEPGGGVAIHTLDLLRRTAACIDLPAESAETARNYTLVLGAGGRRAFAANASAGMVAAVDLVAHRITATARFHPLTDMRPFGGTGTVLRGRAYFGAESSVWSYDIRRNEVTGPYDVGRRVLGIGAAPNARAVRVVRFDGEVVGLRRHD